MLNVSELKTTGDINLFGDLNFYTSPNTAAKFSFPTENITYSFPSLPQVNSVLLINPDGSITYSSSWRFARTVDDQEIGGVKTFTSIPILPASDPTNLNQATRKAYVDTKVSLTGNETISGQKTFTNTPLSTATQSINPDALTKKSYVDSLDEENVKLYSNQMILGIKTFFNIPEILADPTAGSHAANKAYVDTKVSLTEIETISGAKTFSTNPISTAAQSTNPNALTKKSYVDDLNAGNVKLTGDQTIDGVKTFNDDIDLFGDLNFYTSPTTAAKFSFPTENITYAFPSLPQTNSVLSLNPDGTIVYTSTWRFASSVNDQTISGTKTFDNVGPGVRLTTGTPLTFKNDAHRIINNDGLGNFGLRVGYKNNSGAKFTQDNSWAAGINFNIENEPSPKISFLTSTASSTNAGDAAVMTSLLDMTGGAAGNISAAVPLFLPASDPTDPNHAVRKAYVDNLDAGSVKLTGNQTIAGQKTFTNTPLSTAAQLINPDALTKKSYVDGLDTQNVKLTGNQTINGVKTFASIPTLPVSNPTDPNQAARKGYVDTKVSLSGDQTISGVKTFSNIPVLPASNPTDPNQAARKGYVDTKVSLSEDQTIYGVKVFSNIPYLPPSDPIYEDHAVRKEYVDARTSNLAFSSTEGVTSNTNVLPGDNGKTFFANTSSGNVVFNLPASSTVSNGFLVTFIKTPSANNMRINSHSSDTIGSLSYLIYTERFSSVTLILYGQKWYVQSHFNGTLIQ